MLSENWDIFLFLCIRPISAILSRYLGCEKISANCIFQVCEPLMVPGTEFMNSKKSMGRISSLDRDYPSQHPEELLRLLYYLFFGGSSR